MWYLPKHLGTRTRFAYKLFKGGFMKLLFAITLLLFVAPFSYAGTSTDLLTCKDFKTISGSEFEDLFVVESIHGSFGKSIGLSLNNGDFYCNGACEILRKSNSTTQEISFGDNGDKITIRFNKSLLTPGTSAKVEVIAKYRIDTETGKTHLQLHGTAVCISSKDILDILTQN